MADTGLVGWRDRDYARFTDEERRRLYGIPPRGPVPPSEESRGARASLAPQARLALPDVPRNYASFWLRTLDYALLAALVVIGLWVALNALRIVPGPIDYFRR